MAREAHKRLAMRNTFSNREKLQAFFLGIFSGLLGLMILVLILWQLPAMQQRLGWRIDFALTYLRGIVDPVETLTMAVVTQKPDKEGFAVKRTERRLESHYLQWIF